jgi:hypothetical protein
MSSRHKAIAIPMCIINSEPHFLLVHDRRFKEWTFVTGGCRRREIYNPLRCAVRELEEETRGVIKMYTGLYSYYKFSFFDESEVDMENVYHVYILDFPMTLRDQEKIISKFNMNRELMKANKIRFKKQYDENDMLDFDTINGINSRNDIWKMIYMHVVKNSKFIDAIYSQRIPFNLKK